MEQALTTDRPLLAWWDIATDRHSAAFFLELLAHSPEWDVDWDDASLIQTSTVRGYERLPLLV